MSIMIDKDFNPMPCGPDSGAKKQPQKKRSKEEVAISKRKNEGAPMRELNANFAKRNQATGIKGQLTKKFRSPNPGPKKFKPVNKRAYRSFLVKPV